ncbi:flavin reductase family protein [Stieleria varia]|uniref:Flavin reductase like domain protein n=1 Tax=Stieleria varia TaxID=2528005 RepID=A0A5C6B6W3_9BACT|nr:flavin reductase family protein [Stieleria varia]TWU08035.1 Flavin reductase like domain protein [Stieleria varia]
MQLDLNDLSGSEIYQSMVSMITPRPIAWVSTLSTDGVANLAPFSFFTGVGVRPPTLVFCPANRGDGSPKDTLANIQRSGEFVVNIVTQTVARAMHLSAADVSPDVDEFELTGVDKADSLIVKPPRVAQCVAAMECRLHQVIQLAAGPGGANMVVGRIVGFHVDDEIVQDGKMVINTIARSGRSLYVAESDAFSLD